MVSTPNPDRFKDLNLRSKKLQKVVQQTNTKYRCHNSNSVYTFIIMYKSNDGLHNPLHKSHLTVSWHYLSINHMIETFPLASIYSFHTNYQHYLNCCMIY